MNNISLGRYVPYDTVIHKLDPRLKLFSMIVLMVSVFLSFASTYMNFIVYGVLLIFVLVIMKISKIKLLNLFKQLKAMWFMILFLFIINLFTPGTGDYFEPFNNGFKIYYSGIYNTVYIILRLVIMLSLSLILTATTSPLQLTSALEWYLTPFKLVYLPVHEIAMTISLALRFIPTLLEETQRIMKAQASRGVDFENGKLKEKIRAIISLIIPLFISSFQRSEDLANAMEARGYDPKKKRTRYRKNKWGVRDTVSLIVILVMLGGFITLMATGFDLVEFIRGLL